MDSAVATSAVISLLLKRRLRSISKILLRSISSLITAKVRVRVSIGAGAQVGGR
jgi:hypothetical protein